mgnify:FL=1|tara:strand:+ start:392 stop:598 length:207 start_codon:yes stop_codon:yes gene_type:complete
MGESFYKYTDEYRDRFAINQGERYWIEEAFKLYIKTAKKELGPDSIITAPYIEQLFKDISNKLNCWTD